MQMHRIGSGNRTLLQPQIYKKQKIGWRRKLGVGGMVGFKWRLGFVLGLGIACKQK